MTLEEVESILRRHSAEFVRAYVYGSVAEGTQDKHSDVDLILVRKTNKPFFDRIRDIMQIARALGPVDLMIYTPEEQEEVAQGPGRYFIKDVFHRGYRIEGTQV